MKRLTLISIIMLCVLHTYAQNKLFQGKINNEKYGVHINMNFYEQNISVPGQSIYGKLPGYFFSDKSSLIWPITSAEIKNNVATISLINDYGSEDLTCTLTYNQDSTYTLKQIEGSTLKIIVNRKYVKIPKEIILKRN